MRQRTVRILGTHGVPAAYGGFETAAENVGLHLARAGWRVIVYCQIDGKGPIREDQWNGLERVLIPVDTPGWRGTSKFDLLAIRHAIRYRRDMCLSFGYNTAVFNIAQRLARTPLIINMDGIEWSRSRWGKFRQSILYTNERIACLVGNTLIADHPDIETYLRTKAPACKIEMITYGAHAVTDAPTSVPLEMGLTPGGYVTVICRPIPENSLLEIVRAFSARVRDMKLVVLGNYTPHVDAYHQAVMSAASDEVIFPGAIYDPASVAALRFHSAAYIHGHTVGGTNPSLVEAMAAGNPIIAQDNGYNRWTAGPDAAAFFHGSTDAAAIFDELLPDRARLALMSKASRNRYEAEFTWDRIAGQYEEVLNRYLPAAVEGAI